MANLNSNFPNPARRANHSALLSLTHPNKSMFERQRALLRKAVPAGFPSPADDYVERRLSLDEHLIQHRESTFFMRVAGHSMRDLGIFDGDLLVVDRSVPATHGCVVVAVIDGEFTVKQLLYTAQGKVLRAAHPDYPDIAITAEHDFSIWGVVQWNVHKV
ncbi:LexA family protein [Sideroxydans lithotrophicus]|uniref:Peptidase S24/S26A/S26B, conserved region n=1 Tax=Sideroxydans lithotrophicus (strain ES-1) TaxID=580332 RepID=D5CPC9_SIDLE|nr:translesion error-prone DNA polymerase V autoproteolytic subunit [Sideroxydans lithotrophicus]ADE11070.1 Peptidase S24/S26A/S26B, conserved region [Sideroxydans lithotrophicus ES-1]